MSPAVAWTGSEGAYYHYHPPAAMPGVWWQQGVEACQMVQVAQLVVPGLQLRQGALPFKLLKVPGWQAAHGGSPEYPGRQRQSVTLLAPSLDVVLGGQSEHSMAAN